MTNYRKRGTAKALKVTSQTTEQEYRDFLGDDFIALVEDCIIFKEDRSGYGWNTQTRYTGKDGSTPDGFYICYIDDLSYPVLKRVNAFEADYELDD